MCSRSTLSKLRSLEAESDPSVYSPMLESMCQWGKGADVLDLVNEWFEATLMVKKDDDTANTTLNKVSCPDMPIFLLFQNFLLFSDFN